MNCNCVKKLEEQASQMDWKGKKVVEAKLHGIFSMSPPKMEFFTSSELNVKLEGMKKETTIEIRHTYCPFCGKIQATAATNKTG